MPRALAVLSAVPAALMTLASLWAAIGLGCTMAAVALLTRPAVETHEPRLDVHR